MIDIDALTLNISSDENSYCASFSAEITRPQDFNLFNPGTEANLVFYGITYKVLIDERRRGNEFGRKTYSISGRSITAKLGEGWSDAITKTWDAVMASSVVTELCNEVGITSEYLAQDWLIPKGVLSASNEHRITIIKKIADACGAIIQTRANGNLVILSKYKIAPSLIETVTPDLVFAAYNDIIAVQESYDVRSKYNQVIVMNMEDSSDSYSIFEHKELSSDGTCEIGVYVYPFKDTLQLFTSSNSLSISYKEKVIEDVVDELVEIVNGRGSTSKLVKERLNTRYIDNNLGTITIQGNNVQTENFGQSLILLSYRTEYHVFRVQTSQVADPFQIFTTED